MEVYKSRAGDFYEIEHTQNPRRAGLPENEPTVWLAQLREVRDKVKFVGWNRAPFYLPVPIADGILREYFTPWDGSDPSEDVGAGVDPFDGADEVYL